MIAAYAVIVALSLAMGWRGYRMRRFWWAMFWKWLALTVVVTAMALSITLDLQSSAQRRSRSPSWLRSAS